MNIGPCLNHNFYQQTEIKPDVQEPKTPEKTSEAEPATTDRKEN